MLNTFHFHENGHPHLQVFFFLLLLWILYKVSQDFFFFFEYALESDGGMFPCTNIDTSPSVYWAFSCERPSMVMSLHTLSHSCSDSWLQEVLIVLINAPWPSDFFFPFSDRHGMFPFLKFSWEFLEPCSTHTNKKVTDLQVFLFLFFALLAFFCHSLLANTVTNCINGGMPDKKAPPNSNSLL